MAPAQFERKSAFEWHIKPFGRMRVPGVIFASEADLARIDGQSRGLRSVRKPDWIAMPWPVLGLPKGSQ